MAANKNSRSIRKARLLAGLFVALASTSVGANPGAGSAAASAAGRAEATEKTFTLEQACAAIGGRLRSVGKERCLKAGLQLSGGYSIKGMPLLYQDFQPTKPPASGPAHRVLMIGGIHGDELVSVSIAFQWMQRLETEAEQPFHWRVLPATNPDGLLVRPSTRVNSRGVDLNRNFPTEDWKADALAYWQKRARRDPRRYPGPSALSEPETRWLVREIQEFKPDAIVSVHAPYGVLDFDGPENPPTRFGYLRLHQLGTYPGSLGNYGGVHKGVPVVTIELPNAMRTPLDAEMRQMWLDLLRWMAVKPSTTGARTGCHRRPTPAPR